MSERLSLGHIEAERHWSALPPEPHLATLHDGPVRLVFVGRICPTKNLHMVLDALHRLDAPAGLDIYGPLEEGLYWSRCKALIGRLPAWVRARYCGELTPAQTRLTFARYDAFVFPTLGEEVGHIIAESLSASCPVICSTKTPWTDLLISGGGIVLPELNPGRLADEIARVAAASHAERAGARQRAGAAYRSWRGGVHRRAGAGRLGAHPSNT